MADIGETPERHVIEPAHEAELTDAIARAVAEGSALEIVGAGTKRAWGEPVRADRTLSLKRLRGIGYYEPGELVIEAAAGTPLADIEAALAENGQQLAFEPADLGPLFGVPAGAGTLGGLVACNLSGPRRPFAGAARDHVLGIRAVSGRGELFVSGGRVVKNVTGYDLSKLLAGSFGTLAVITQATLKVLPGAAAERTVLLPAPSLAAALPRLAEAQDGPWEVSGAACLPATAAARSGVAYVSGMGRALAALRLEGSRDGVIARAAALVGRLASGAAYEELYTANSRRFWKELADGALLPRSEGGALWRIVVPPAGAAGVLAEAGSAIGGEALIDWAGGLVWLAQPPEVSSGVFAAAAGKLRAAVGRAGGQATLMRAPGGLAEGVPAFQPLAPALARLNGRVRRNFDPENILNPGRMGREAAP